MVSEFERYFHLLLMQKESTVCHIFSWAVLNKCIVFQSMRTIAKFEIAIFFKNWDRDPDRHLKIDRRSRSRSWFYDRRYFQRSFSIFVKRYFFLVKSKYLFLKSKLGISVNHVFFQSKDKISKNSIQFSSQWSPILHILSKRYDRYKDRVFAIPIFDFVILSKWRSPIKWSPIAHIAMCNIIDVFNGYQNDVLKVECTLSKIPKSLSKISIHSNMIE